MYIYVCHLDKTLEFNVNISNKKGQLCSACEEYLPDLSMFILTGSLLTLECVSVEFMLSQLVYVLIAGFVI